MLMEVIGMMGMMCDDDEVSAQIGAWHQHHRQSGAPLLAWTKESGSGDGTRGLRPEGVP